MADNDARGPHRDQELVTRTREMMGAVAAAMSARQMSSAVRRDGAETLMGKSADELWRSHVVRLDTPLEELAQTIYDAFGSIPNVRNREQFVRVKARDVEAFDVDIAHSPQLQAELTMFPTIEDLRRRTPIKTRARDESPAMGNPHAKTDDPYVKSPILIPQWEQDDNDDGFSLGI